jgi:hypothetical protein
VEDNSRHIIIVELSRAQDNLIYLEFKQNLMPQNGTLPWNIEKPAYSEKIKTETKISF